MPSYNNSQEAAGPIPTSQSSQNLHTRPSADKSHRPHQLNTPSSLISLTRSNNNFQTSRLPILQNNPHKNASEKPASQNEDAASSSLPPISKYSKDQLVTSKPPLPSSASRTPSRLSMSQRNSSGPNLGSWASSTTPRMRVPVTEPFLPIITTNNRPASPITRSYHAQNVVSIPIMQSNAGGTASSSSVMGSSVSKFKYNGPHQIYAGPNASVSTPREGPEQLGWIMSPHSSEAQIIQPPPPPPSVLKDLQYHPSNPPSATNIPPSTSTGDLLNRTKTEEEFLMKVLQAVRQSDSVPFQSQQGSMSMLLPTPATASQSPSFPSAQSFEHMEQAPVCSNPAIKTPKPPVGPFVNCGIPNEIQDDLLKIEMLLEFRKYKEALHQKIQNQNHILTLVSNGSSLNSQQQQQHNFQRYNLHYPPPPRQQQYPQSNCPFHTSLSTLMSSPEQASKSNSSGGGGVADGLPDLTSDEKPPWSEDVAEPFTSPNFTLNTFMEPHILASQSGQQSNHHPQHQQQSNSSGNRDRHANSGKPISLLQQTRNFDEFQALADQSRSGFSSAGVIQQNPLLEGAQQYQNTGPVTPLFPYIPQQSRPNMGLPGDINKVNPIRIQVAPKDPPEQVPQQHEQNIVQQQYQKYLLDRSFQSLSPNSFKIMESMAMGRDNSAMRRPVTIAVKSPTSPQNSQDGSSSPNNSTIATHGDGEFDRPSPFFPGFSHNPIDMKLRIDEEGAANAAMTQFEGMQELGNLLSKLPVLTRKEKVEEFQALNTLKPATPATEADSVTSMIPMVSSNGTLTSEKRPDTAETKLSRWTGDTEEDFTNVDPNKMNFNELVSLGRKIYGILSQLSTNPNIPANNNVPHQQHQVITTPMTLNFPSPNTPVFTTSNPKNGVTPPELRPSGSSSPLVVVDFNNIPNPTFITGRGPVGSSKNASKVVTSPLTPRSRTPVRPPHLFRKVLHPPPTRWEGRQRGTAVSNPPPSAPTRLTGLVTPKHSQTHQEQQKRQSSRSKFIYSKSSTKVAPSSSRMITTPRPLHISTQPFPSSTKLPATFTVRERFSHNSHPTNTSRLKHQQRQATPYPYSTSKNAVDTEKNQISHITTPPARRARSNGKNFIMENIAKVRMMKKLPDSRVRPRKLPAVSKKKYEHVPSTIPGSRSRSNSATANVSERQSFYDRYGRSSSVPATSAGGGYSPARNYPNRSVSTPRPSTGMSVHVATSRSSVQTRIDSRPMSQGNAPPRPASRSRPVSQGIIVKPQLGSVVKGGTKSKVKFESSVVKLENVVSTTGNQLVAARKSRSKTKRVNIQKKNSIASTGYSSGTSAEPASQQKPKPKTAKAKPAAKNQKTRKGKKIMGETVSDATDEELTPAKGVLFNSESEQRMIREMVKAEMSMIVERQVKCVLKDQQQQQRPKAKSKERVHEVAVQSETFLESQQRRQDYDEEVDEGGDTEGGETMAEYEEERQDNEFGNGQHLSPDRDHDDTPGIESDNITPVYTPPKYYDESLFNLEKWINPDGHLPVSANTSAKETPATTANNDNNSIYGIVTGGGRKMKASSKPQTVRFSLPSPQVQQQQQSK